MWFLLALWRHSPPVLLIAVLILAWELRRAKREKRALSAQLQDLRAGRGEAPPAGGGWEAPSHPASRPEPVNAYLRGRPASPPPETGASPASRPGPVNAYLRGRPASPPPETGASPASPPGPVNAYLRYRPASPPPVAGASPASPPGPAEAPPRGWAPSPPPAAGRDAAMPGGQRPPADIPHYAPAARPGPGPAPAAPGAPPPEGRIQVVLVVGVLFVLLAGLIFATTTWRFLPGAVRLLLILSGTLLFFGASALARLRLRLPQTGRAFYALGSLFLPVCVLAIGYLRLLGPWLAPGGGGYPLLPLGGGLLLGLCALYGAREFKSTPFAWLALGCVTLCLSSAAALFRPPRDVALLLFAAYTLALVLLGPAAERAAGRCGAHGPVLQRVPLFAAVHLGFSCLWLLEPLALYGWNTTLLLAAAVLCAALTAGMRGRYRPVLAPVQPLLLLLFFFGLAGRLPAGWPAGGAAALLCAATLPLLRLGPKDGRGFFTVPAQLTLLAGCLLGGLYDGTGQGAPWSLPGLLLFVALVGLLALCWQGPLHKAALWALPYCPLLLLPGLAGLFKVQGRGLFSLAYTALLAATAAALLLFASGRPAAARLELPLGCAALVLSLGGFWVGMAFLTVGYPFYLWMASGYLGVQLAQLLRGKTGRLGAALGGEWLFWLTGAGLLAGAPLVFRLLRPGTLWSYALCAPALLCLAGWCAHLALAGREGQYPAGYLGGLLYHLGAGGMGVCAPLLSAAFLAERPPLPFALVCAAFLALGCAARYYRRRTLGVVVPLLAYYPLLFGVCRRLWGAGSLNLCALAGFFTLALCSRLLHRRLYERAQGRLAGVDWFHLLNLFAPAWLLLASHDQIWHFVGMLLCALWAMLLRGRIPRQNADRAVYTAAAVCLTLAFWMQPFWRPGPVLSTEWAMLPLLPLFLLLGRLWRDHRQAVGALQFEAAALCDAILLLRALLFGRVVNAILLGLVALMVLLFSLQAHSKRWLFLAAGTMAALALFFTRGFWRSIPWWLYLLGAGALLIAWASLHELCRQRGVSLKVWLLKGPLCWLRGWHW